MQVSKDTSAKCEKLATYIIDKVTKRMNKVLDAIETKLQDELKVVNLFEDEIMYMS